MGAIYSDRGENTTRSHTYDLGVNFAMCRPSQTIISDSMWHDTLPSTEYGNKKSETRYTVKAVYYDSTRQEFYHRR